jgi:hypothetical protein
MDEAVCCRLVPTLARHRGWTSSWLWAIVAPSSDTIMLSDI